MGKMLVDEGVRMGALQMNGHGIGRRHEEPQSASDSITFLILFSLDLALRGRRERKSTSFQT